MLRHKNTNLFPDFSERLKKIIFRNPKMDIFKMSKNVQKRKIKGSFKRGIFMFLRGIPRENNDLL